MPKTDRRALRLALAAVAIACSLVAAPASAAETGTIQGRVINASTGRPQSGVTVTLTSAKADGTEQERTRVETSKDGRYTFGDLPTGDALVYAVDASFQGGIFAGGVIFLPDDTAKSPVVETKLRVWPTTTDPAVIQIPRNSLFASQQANSVGVIESVTLFNSSQKAYIGRGRASGGDAATPSVAFALPETAVRDDNGSPQIQIIKADIDLPTLLPSEFGFAATAAIPPGQHKVTFTYVVPGTGGSFDISRRALYTTVKFEVYAAPPLEIRSNRLTEEGEVAVGDKDYVRYSSADPIEAGDPIQALAIAEAGTPAALVGGAIAIGAVILLLGGFGLLRLRGRKPPKGAEPTAEDLSAASQRADERQELLVAIAKLDLQREADTITEEQWRNERDALKKRLETPVAGSRTQ
jgi:hypothetical protein